VSNAIDVEVRDSLRVTVHGKSGHAMPALWEHDQRGKAPTFGDPFLPHLPTGLEG
jgi:hypothetical protein